MSEEIVTSAVREQRSHDAVIVVPGIMGSELRDSDGRVLWGLTPGALRDAYRGDLLERLKVTEADLASNRGIRATGLIRYPTALGWFLGNESYAKLMSFLKTVTVDPRAVRAFPYDWRLPITLNGEKLGDFILRFWEEWRTIADNERICDPSEVGISVIAHSMGGLVARAAQQSKLDGTPTQILTLGTPYYGSVKAVRLLIEGAGSPLPALTAKVRAFALTSPGVHDLLPRYKCITEGADLRKLAISDITEMGVDSHLASAAEERWLSLAWDKGPGAVLWHTAAGVGQPTIQTLTLKGAATYHSHVRGVNYGGDGTVYRRAAGPGWPHHSATAVAQSHGALAATDRLTDFVRDKLLGQDARPPLSTSSISVQFPENAGAGTRLILRAGRYPDQSDSAHGSHHLVVTSKNLATNKTSAWTPAGVASDGWLTVVHEGLPPGLHRITVSGGGGDPVTELLWLETDEA